VSVEAASEHSEPRMTSPTAINVLDVVALLVTLPEYRRVAAA
jgi:hypothetical protein